MSLSPEQRAALWDGRRPLGGLWSLSARPGTGKTTTVTEYCRDLTVHWRERHETWQGMAVLSYTNVAKDELADGLRRGSASRALLQHPHFVGTLDAFLNQYLFLPHGAATMGISGQRPTLVGEPFHTWNPPWALHNSCPSDAYKPMFFDCYTLGLGDRPILIDASPRTIGSASGIRPPRISDNSRSKIINLKRYVWSRGMALQSDANYLAYQVLRSRPQLAMALGRRFPVFVIDEAQDMTEVQHAIIDLLINAGLSNVLLVGDENQAIYEWNTARPDLFTGRRAAAQWNTRTLAETYRCSPAICATLTALASDNVDLVPAAGAKNTSYGTPVQVESYRREDESAAVTAAIDKVAHELSDVTPHDDNSAGIKSVVVICRSADDARHLYASFAKAPTPGTGRIAWKSPLTRDFLMVIYHLERGELYRAARAYEAVLTRAGDHSSTAEARVTIMRARSLSATDVVGYRVMLFADLNRIKAALPDEPVRISASARLAALGSEALGSSLRNAIWRDLNAFAEASTSPQDRPISALFGTRGERAWIAHPDVPTVRILFATAHAVKGETYDAVVFFTRHRVLSCGCSRSAGTWKAILSHSMLECETKRVAYVACSRAAQSLLILAPPESLAPWQELVRYSNAS